MQWLKWIAIVVLVLVLAAILAGRFGWLQGRAPADLGVRDGRLKPPARTPNSVSSQARLYPQHPRHAEAQIEPLHYTGDPRAAFARLKAVVEAMPGAAVQRSEPGYLYATYTTPLMRFVDDVEFALDPAAGVIEVRSASRLGHGDRGLNRERIEDLRRRFDAAR
jgi:uncharacterized protein (DUF1499 family)